MSLTLVKSNRKFLGFAVFFAGALITIVTILSLQTVKAADPTERLVTIHDGDIETSIVTHATTVRDALRQASIKTSAYDNVDPSIDTEIKDSTYQVNVYRAQPVMVVDGSTKKTVMTAFEAPELIAQDAGLPLYDEDTTELLRSSDILDSGGTGLTLTIDRATRFVLVLYGKTVKTGTQATTVEGMIKEKNIKLGKDDTVSVSKSKSITAGMRIEIWRNGKQTVTEEKPIAFPVQQIQDPNQPVGYRKIKTPGINGKKMVTYEVEMRNGKEVARKEIQSVKISSPHMQVEIVGSKPSFSGDFGAALAKLRSCEGGYSSWNPAGYYGAYQFDRSTWSGVADPAKYGNASPAEQDAAAYKLYQKRGWSPWPNCGRGLPDTYR